MDFPHPRIQVLIEAEQGSRIRNTYNSRQERTGKRETNTPYPFPYGAVLGTLADDGDEVDCYILTNSGPSAGSVVDCQIVGMLEMFENEEHDFKLIAVLSGGEMEPEEIDFSVVTIKDFIQTIFRKYPEVRLSFGRYLPPEAALAHLAVHQAG